MLAIDCPSIGARVLIWTSSIRWVGSSPDGLDAHVRCACGEPAEVRFTDGRSHLLRHGSGPGRPKPPREHEPTPVRITYSETSTVAII
jgi:hypothetical protein